MTQLRLCERQLAWSVLAALVVVAAMTAAGCAARRPAPAVPEASAPGRPDAPSADVRRAVTAAALSLRGTPYLSGGSTPRGFDCSGFTRFVFGQQGIQLPRQTTDQYRVGTRVGSFNDLRPGDLVFFSTVSKGPSHVGVALGDGRFIHAPSTRGVVRIERLGVTYWSRRFLGGRRILE